MAKYRIGLTQQVYEECTVYVEAETPEAAERAAIEKANAGDVEWHFLAVHDGPVEPASVDVVI